MIKITLHAQGSNSQQSGSHAAEPTDCDEDDQLWFSQADFEESAFQVLSSEDEVHYITLCITQILLYSQSARVTC